jgi:preprotein translocase subunit SecE
MQWIIDNFRQIFLAVGGAILLAIIVKNYVKIKKFLLEVKLELKKVSWSTKEELFAATLMVIVITALLSIFIGTVDFIYSEILRRMMISIK